MRAGVLGGPLARGLAEALAGWPGAGQEVTGWPGVGWFPGAGRAPGSGRAGGGWDGRLGGGRLGVGEAGPGGRRRPASADAAT